MAASSTTSLPISEENVLTQRTNGGETSQNSPRRWERPWSLHEIHAEAGNWSLAGDAGLLQHLQDFSQRMISHTHQIGKDVDDLVHDAKLMGVRVNNVINDFIMLANTQFVENRVYDEDVTEDVSNKEERKVEQEKTKEQREAEIIPRVAYALKLGIDVIDNAFVKLDARVVDSDSEEEDNSGSAEAILEAKDPYATRPLPFLIGTPKFMEDDNIGLVEESSEEEDQSDQGSISISEDDSEAESEESQREYSTSEESEEADRKKTTEGKKRDQTEGAAASGASEDDSDQDMFSVKRSRAERNGDDSAHIGDVSSSEEDEPQPKERHVPGAGIPKDLSSELASRLAVGASKQSADRSKSNEEEDGWSEETKRKDSQSSGKYPQDAQKGKKEKDKAEGKTDKLKSRHSKQKYEDDDLFGRDERKDEYDDLFGKDGGLFSSSKGLFDDRDEGDLFAEVKKPVVITQKPNKKDEKPKKGDDSLFAAYGEANEGDDILPKPKTSSTHTVKKPTAQPAAPPGREVTKGGGAGGGLFDESEDEDDDLFGEASKKVRQAGKETSTKKITPQAVKKLDLFNDDADEDNDDLFGSMAASVVKSKTHSNVGLTVEGYDEEETVEEKRLQDEQLRKKATPEKKLPPGAMSMFGKGSNPILEALKKQQQIPSSSDEDENLSVATEDRSSRNSSIHSISSATSALKTGERAKDGPAFNSNNIGDSKEEDPFLSPLSKSGREGLIENDSNVSKSITNPADHHQEKSDKSKSSKDSLFDSSGDEHEDIFSSIVKPVESKKPGRQVSMLGDSSNAAVKSEKDAASRHESQHAIKKKGSALFEDEVDDEPLFLSKPLQAAGGTNISKNKTQGLFAHDDLHSVQDENPSVDLFSSKDSSIQPSQQKALQQPTAIPPKKAPSSSRPVAAGLFSGDDDDDDRDLFSVKPVTSSPAVKAASVDLETGSSQTVKKDKTLGHETPAGAVSVAGGLEKKPTHGTDKGKDAGTVKEEGKRAVTEERVAAHVSVAKPLPIAGLFADDDDEDLFSPKSGPVAVTDGAAAKESTETPADKEVVVFSKPEIKAKKPVGSVSKFGAVDPAGLKKEKIVELSDEKKNEGSEETKTLPPQIAAKPKVLKEKTDNVVKAKSNAAGGLFGDDGGDDLFAAATKKTPAPVMTPKPHVPPVTTPKPHVPPVTTPKPHVPPAGTPVASKEPPKLEREADTGRPRALAGAVPMFGGVNPFTAVKRTSETENERETSSQTEVSANLDARRPVLDNSHSVPASVDFDQPIETETLTSASKDRPKLNRRRPQSRKARLQAAAQTNMDFEDPTIPTTLPSANKASPPSENHLHVSGETYSTPKSDLLRRDPHLEDLKEKLQPPAGQGAASVDGLFTSDLFNGKDTKSAKTSAEDLVSDLNRPVPGREDLFSDLNRPVPGRAKTTIDEPKPPRKEIGLNINAVTDLSSRPVEKSKSGDLSTEDLFSDLGKRDPAVSKNAIDKMSRIPNVAKNKNSNDLFTNLLVNSTADDLSSISSHDDLLSSLSTPSTGDKSKLTSDFDDDDLFKPSVKAPVAKSKLVIEKAIDDDLFSTFQPSSVSGSFTTGQKSADIFHEDNLFGISSMDKQKDTKARPDRGATEHGDLMDAQKSNDAKNARPKRAVAKESNLLKDTTDIFSDVPTPAPREPKKKTPKKVAEKNVFQGDIDDIFADSTAVTIKPKRDAKKKLAKPTSVVSDNIFDDPLS